MYLITGCNGQLGRELTARISNAIATDSDTLDITDFDAVQKFVRENNIDTIINCAAYTAVDRAESDVDLATHVNVNGPEIWRARAVNWYIFPQITYLTARPTHRTKQPMQQIQHLYTEKQNWRANAQYYKITTTQL